MHKRKVSLIVCALILLTLIGCSSRPKVIHIKAEPIDPVPLILPDVDRLELENTKFYVVTEKNGQEVFDKLREKNYDPVIFGVTDDGYEILSVNRFNSSAWPSMDNNNLFSIWISCFFNMNSV